MHLRVRIVGDECLLQIKEQDKKPNIHAKNCRFLLDQSAGLAISSDINNRNAKTRR